MVTTTLKRGPATSLDQDPSRPMTTDLTGASRWLVGGGVAAGPLFVVASVAHAAVRDGAAFSDHPPSALSNGDLGWVQITTFAVAGLLLTGAALALRGRLRGAGSVWGPRLLSAFGLGLIGGGVFRMDPAFGFPPGTPVGKPDAVSWHGAAHGLVFAVAFFALMAACFVFARRYRSLHRAGLRWLSLATGPAVLVLTAWPNFGEPDGRFLPLWLGVIVSLAWTSVVIADARRDLMSDTTSSD